MASYRSRIDTVQTDRTHAPGATAWVVLLDDTISTTPESRDAVSARLTRHGFSVLRVQPSLQSSRRGIMSAVADGVAALGADDPTRPVLFAGSGRLASVAALAAVEHDAAGLLSVDGPLLSVAWRLHHLSGPTLLLGTDAASRLTTGGLRLTAAALGSQGRFVRDDTGGLAGDRALRDWGTAVDRGAWPVPAPTLSRSRRLALPAAAALLTAPAAVALTASPVGASQRAGDGVAVAHRTSSPARTLRANKVPRSQRHGDGLFTPHDDGSQALVDQAGFKWFINTSVTFPTTSSASGGMSEGQYTHAVPASTLNGGTTNETLTDAYDGYNTMAMSVNGTVCQETGQDPASCTWYNNNGPAATDCNGREIVLPNQAIDGLTVSRRDYVPSDDHFERTLNVFTNPTSAPITVTMSVLNNLGSDNNTVITGTSSGDSTPSTADNWVTTFQNWSGTTSSDPRLGHVLQGTGAAVTLSSSFFQNGNDNPYWTYDFTVAPGQTRIIANFAVADATIAQSKADSARLAALSPTAIECMSSTDLANLANFHYTAPTPPPTPTSTSGFRTADTAGGVYSFGAAFDGSLPGLGVKPSKPITALASTPDGHGYWLADADGGVYSFGDAVFGGSLPGLGVTPASPVGAMAAAKGGGYWMAAANGAVYALGGAPYLGSLTGLHITPNEPIVGMAATPNGGGYWLVGGDGAVYAFGNAAFEGSLPGLHVTPNEPIVGMAATANGAGYWLVGADGAVYAFGNAAFEGSVPGLHVTPNKPIVGITATPDGGGYWLAGADGGTFNFGDAGFLGSAAGLTSGHTVVGSAPGS